ncbi:MAG: SDR family oxidoreductase [Deltaproteobacteria bacterium]
MIIVTGASGLLGASLIRHLQETGREFVGLYHHFSLRALGVNSFRINLMDHGQVKDLVTRLRPRWVIHCAAFTNVDWCEENSAEAYQMNTQVTRELARWTRQVGAGLLYVSTDSVFDGIRGDYGEEDQPAPLNVYARSKLAGEKAVQEEGDHTLTVRTNIYGWNIQEKQSLAEWILERLETGQSFLSFTNVFFTPILVNDLSEILLGMIDRQLNGLYHVAGSQACSKYEFALELAELFGLEKDLVQAASLADSTLKAPRPRNTSLRSTKVSQALGRPMPDLKTGILRFKALRGEAKILAINPDTLEGGERR